MAKKEKNTFDPELEEFKEKSLEEGEEDANPEEESEEDAKDKEPSKQEEETEQLLAQERLRREEAEHKLEETRQKARERWEKRRAEEEETRDEQEKPLTAVELRDILAEEREFIRKETFVDKVRAKAHELSTSESEANLVFEIHKNRNWPAYMSIDEQVEEAWAIANRRKLLAQNEELRRALKSKETKKVDATGTYREIPKAGEPKLASHDKTEIERQGFMWDGKFFSKKLSNGKTLFKDWKTKKTWVK